MSGGASGPPWRQSRNATTDGEEKKGVLDVAPRNPPERKRTNEKIVSYQVGDKVRMRDKAEEKWKEGTVTAVEPLKAKPDGWKHTYLSGFRWNFVEKKFSPPEGPPGQHWKKYSDDDFLWWYYEGPAGKWWCNDGEGQKVVPYKLNPLAITGGP